MEQSDLTRQNKQFLIQLKETMKKILEMPEYTIFKKFLGDSILEDISLNASFDNPNERMAYFAGRLSILSDIETKAFMNIEEN